MNKKLRRFRDFTVIMTVALAPFTLLGLETAIGAGVVWASMVVVAAVVVPLGPETDEEWLELIRRWERENPGLRKTWSLQTKDLIYGSMTIAWCGACIYVTAAMTDLSTTLGVTAASVVLLAVGYFGDWQPGN
jgi:hypothetical protein